MKNFKRAIIFLLIVLAFSSCFIGCNEETQPIVNQNTAEATLTVTKSSQFLLSGSITFKNFSNGEYKIYFGDENGKKLDMFTPVAELTYDGGATVELNDLVLPPEARTFVIYNSDDAQITLANSKKSIKIPDTCLNIQEDPFIFSALSDVHYGRYNASGVEGGDDAVMVFDNALDFLEEIDVEFVAIAGDITNYSEIESFEKFNEAIKDREFPVITCAGNHDIKAVREGIWRRYMNPDIANDPNASDFGRKAIDFVYRSEKGDGVFVFLSQTDVAYHNEDVENGTRNAVLSSAQLDWLKNVAEKYKDETVYLFFHTFLCGPDGEGHTGVGNLRNPGGYEYDLPYPYGAKDEVVFRNILKEYKNIVYFSGHSHWMFELEIYNEITNFSNFDGEYGYMVHVPSVTAPRYIGENDTARTEMNTKSSQGWIIYEYDECIVFIPVDFLTRTYFTEYMEIICFNEVAQ